MTTDRPHAFHVGYEPWNKGLSSVDQNLPEGFRRCTQQRDPRCKRNGGVHLMSNYRFNSNLGRYRSDCRFCESYTRYMRSRSPDRLDEYRKYQREYKRKVYEMAINHKPYQVLYDPERMYRRGAEFSKADFENSLAGTVWPQGMFVRYLDNKKCYRVTGTELAEVADRDWREYARTQLDNPRPSNKSNESLDS